MRVTNNSGINLPLAVWLLSDDYDYVEGVDNYISVTKLMNPLRQIILPRRISAEQLEVDVEEFTARKLGHAIHDSIEKAWKTNYGRSMKLLGYSDQIIARIAINPTEEELRTSNSMIPVYIEQRAMRTIDGYTIGGKFDMVTEGIVNDNKSTSVWTWIKGAREDEHRLQGSLYRWLNPTKITEDFIRINYIFTDWNKSIQRQYGLKRVEHKDIPLLTIEQTEQWIRNKLAQIQRHWNSPESEIPECTDEELWRSDPVHKYFSDPAKAVIPGAKSSKNFSDLAEAHAHAREKGKGTVITVPGEVKRCDYCPAFDACTQKDRYFL